MVEERRGIEGSRVELAKNKLILNPKSNKPLEWGLRTPNHFMQKWGLKEARGQMSKTHWLGNEPYHWSSVRLKLERLWRQYGQGIINGYLLERGMKWRVGNEEKKYYKFRELGGFLFKTFILITVLQSNVSERNM